MNTSKNDTTLWNFLAPADRETFISGTLAWLMDHHGTHGLGKEFLEGILKKTGIQVQLSDNMEVKPEDTSGTDKRFDITVKDNNKGLFIVFEVKCKTKGSKEQLERYLGKAQKVVRIGFGEWTFPDLTNSDRNKFPLVKLSDVNTILKSCSSFSSSAYYNFLSDFSEHLCKESDYFKSLKEYFIDETLNDMPTPPTFHRYSQGFYNHLYWEWFRDRLKRENKFPHLEWDSKSQTSGSWLASYRQSVESNQNKEFPSLNLTLSGEFKYWIHIEFKQKKGIVASTGETIGYVQLRIADDNIPPNHRKQLYRIISSPNPYIQKQKFSPPKRAPGLSQWYYSALKRNLEIEKFRFSNLVEIINLLT